jgi:hypothetical protein
MMEPDLVYDTNRGVPMSPELKVCLALSHYGGGHFQRVSGLYCGVSQYAARQAVVQVTDSLVSKRGQFIFMPTVTQMEETSRRMFERFHLPKFGLAVDGVQVRFQDAPRKLPGDKHPQQYWCRKQCFALNVQVVANQDYFCDIDVGWPGSTHDARVWARSEVKQYLEQQRRFLVAADSGYPISEVVIKPYSTNESAQDARKKTFNRRLSGLRTVMTENLFGIWKRRFPILKALRTDFSLSQKTVVATAVLFNIGRMLNDEAPEDDPVEGDEVLDEEGRHLIEDDAGSVRLRGQAERDRLCNNMRM